MLRMIAPDANGGNWSFSANRHSPCAGQVECNRLVSMNTIDWSVAMQMGGQVHAITQLIIYATADSEGG